MSTFVWPYCDGHHVVDHAHVEEEPQRLERARYAALRDRVRRQPTRLVAVEQDLAGFGPVDPGDQVEQRRLAGPVRPDHADDLVLVDDEVEVVDHDEAAERHRQATELEQPLRRRSGHQTISTRAVPSRPCGRVAMSPISMAPKRTKAVMPPFCTSRFSHASAVR